MSPERTFALDSVPEGAVPYSVTAAPAIIGGRSCVRVELTDEITLRGEPFVDYIDQPTFLALPVHLRTGRIEMDILSRLNYKTACATSRAGSMRAAATVWINGETVLVVDEPKTVVRSGGVGLFVDIGSEGSFADLTITPSD